MQPNPTGPQFAPLTRVGAVLATAALLGALLTTPSELAGQEGRNTQEASASSAALAPAPVFYACYVRASGTTYRIKEPGTPETCHGDSHVQFSWTDGVGGLRVGDAAGGDLGGTFPQPTVIGLQGRAVSSMAPENDQVLAWLAGAWRPRTLPSGIEAHGELSGLQNDDHPQYLLVDGTRGMAGDLNLAGFRISGLAAATGPGEAVRFQQAVKVGDVADGDLSGTYPNPQVHALRGHAISGDAPTLGQVLAYDGVRWTPSTLGTGAGSHGELTGLELDDHAQYLLTNGVRNSVNGFAVTGTMGTGAIPVEGAGTRVMWYPGKAAFRAGGAQNEWDDANVGQWSVAMGFRTMASGSQSTALGANTVASGLLSTAIGFDARATAQESFAIGSGARANGGASMALGVGGNFTIANGTGSLAAGHRSFANGANSTVLGSFATSLEEHEGAFVYGDRSSTSAVATTGANQFVVRAAGGFRFRTSANLSTGCDLPSGSGTFSCTSSRHAKMGFEAVDAENVLKKIEQIPIQSWSYINEGAQVRHLGPTAQDFHAAFGLGSSDEAISLVDADGINMLAIQALIERTRVLQETADRVQGLEERIRQLEARLAALEAHPRP